MKRLLLLAAAALSATPAAAKTVMFTGTRANFNKLFAPGTPPCAPTYFNTVKINNIAPNTSSGLSNLGAFTSTQQHCIVTAPPTSIANGVFTYDFAQGDQLFGTYTGNVSLSGTPGVFNAVENLVATGGTGRFAGASGMFSTMGQLTMANGFGTYAGTLNGTLDLPAVPEPTQWTLLITGFGMAGAALRRRRELATVAG